MKNPSNLVLALIAFVAIFIMAGGAAIIIGSSDVNNPKATPKNLVVAPRPLVTVAPPQRDLGVTMDYARSPNVIVTTPGTDSGLPEARVFTAIRFSIDGKLVKTRTAPPYTLTNLTAGSHVLTVTGTASGGDNGRIQESYTK